LAQKYGVHRATVSKHLTRHNVVRRQHGLTKDEAAEAVKLHGVGISMRAIARTLGVDRKQVRVSLVAAGSLAAS
jgi:predicted regulator of amino acid metabolism with ACT domain